MRESWLAHLHQLAVLLTFAQILAQIPQRLALTVLHQRMLLCNVHTPGVADGSVSIGHIGTSTPHFRRSGGGVRWLAREPGHPQRSQRTRHTLRSLTAAARPRRGREDAPALPLGFLPPRPDPRGRSERLAEPAAVPPALPSALTSASCHQAAPDNTHIVSGSGRDG